MGPLVLTDPLATGLFAAGFACWVLSDLTIQVRKGGGTGEDLDKGSRGWVVISVAIGVLAAVDLANRRVAIVPGWPPVVIGLVMVLAGIALRQWAVSTLGAYFTTSVEIQRDHRIVDRGPYALLRHPSYTGALLSAAGIALMPGSWLGCVACVVCALAGLGRRIVVEERALASHLGPDWTEFARHRKRIVPFVW